MIIDGKMNVLVTSGGTLVPLDEVRRIQNMSSGRFGAKIAAAVLKRKHRLEFLYAHNSATPYMFARDMDQMEPEDEVKWIRQLLDMQDFWFDTYHSYEAKEYKTFWEYYHNLEAMVLACPDVVILAAAVSDYGPDVSEKPKGKISSSSDQLDIQLKPLPKVIDKVKVWNPDVFLVGFKLLVDATHAELAAAAKHQIERANVDLVVTNDLRSLKQGNHTLKLFDSNGFLRCLEEENCAQDGVELADVLFKVIEREAIKKLGEMRDAAV